MEIGESVSVPAIAAEESDKPRISAVAILHGDDKTVLVGGGKQFVNLKKDVKWVDNVNVLNLERLGFKLRIKVSFDRPGSHNFKLKLDPGSSNSKYSDSEKGRNSNFSFQDAEKAYTTDGDGTKIIESDFLVTAAGNDTYQPVAGDDFGNEVKGGVVTTRRLAYYVELKMKGLLSVASDLKAFTAEYNRHKIQMVSLGAIEMDHMPNISNTVTDVDNFKAKARTAYNNSKGPAHAPYVIAIAYTDHLAVKDSDRKITKSGIEVGAGKPDVEISIVDTSTIPPTTKYLWHDLVPGEGWFVSAHYLPDGGVVGKDEVALAQASCIPIPLNAMNPDLWDKVKVKVSGLPSGQGSITLKIHWVNRMRGGLSMAGNIVCICSRAWWKDKTTADQNQVVSHEVGHQMGMVADGTGKGPDKVPTHYSGKGHVGPHCYYNLGVKASYVGGKGVCVMFGATNGINRFCANCTIALLKQDLSAGWSAF